MRLLLLGLLGVDVCGLASLQFVPPEGVRVACVFVCRSSVGRSGGLVLAVRGGAVLGCGLVGLGAGGCWGWFWVAGLLVVGVGSVSLGRPKLP